MVANNEIAFIFQCTLCGSFALIAVDSLNPVEVSREAAGIRPGSSVLQRDIHAAEQTMLEQIQRRVGCERSCGAEASIGSASCRFALLPCATCIEIQTGRMYDEWLDDKRNLQGPCPFSPHLPVRFDSAELSPAYRKKGDSWRLLQGVGPQDLVVKATHLLPAGQFRQLLPPTAPLIRPECWPHSGNKDLVVEPGEVWEARKDLLATVQELLLSADGSSCSMASSSVPPPIGDVLPWFGELCDAALGLWRTAHPKRGNSTRPSPGTKRTDALDTTADYVRVPLLQVAEALRPALADQLASVQLGPIF